MADFELIVHLLASDVEDAEKAREQAFMRLSTDPAVLEGAIWTAEIRETKLVQLGEIRELT